ncbi:MAG: flagellar assembly lytic transglycosylase, partial [Spirochaetia bacterium]
SALDPSQEPEAQVFPENEYEDFLAGFFRYPNPEMVYAFARQEEEALSAHAVREAVRFLFDSGNYLHSLRLFRILEVRPDYEFTVSDLELKYPLAYTHEIRNASQEYTLPLSLFMGLVRQESGFESEIQSRAGATGLAQLMPSTAGDVAQRMGIEEIDLTNPAQNLAMGAYYLSNLYRSTGIWAKSLMGYNAGPGRVRRWNNRFGNLPIELFIEAVPITETRNYVKYVLAGAAIYGYLYPEVEHHPIRVFLAAVDN